MFNLCISGKRQDCCPTAGPALKSGLAVDILPTRLTYATRCCVLVCFEPEATDQLHPCLAAELE